MIFLSLSVLFLIDIFFTKRNRRREREYLNIEVIYNNSFRSITFYLRKHVQGILEPLCHAKLLQGTKLDLSKSKVKSLSLFCLLCASSNT